MFLSLLFENFKRVCKIKGGFSIKMFLRVGGVFGLGVTKQRSAIFDFFFNSDTPYLKFPNLEIFERFCFYREVLSIGNSFFSLK